VCRRLSQPSKAVAERATWKKDLITPAMVYDWIDLSTMAT